MATVPQTRRVRQPTNDVPPLENGDRLDQKTFHARYEAMPSDVRAQLIGGIVYMSSPQKRPHSRAHKLLARWLDEYEEVTAGTEFLPNLTDVLGSESEPEPDGLLLILPECGGQTWQDDRGYLYGAPELVAEVAWATESIDLHAKKDDYEKAGVREYVVVALRTGRVFWFVRRRGKFKEMSAGGDEVFRSEVFPGLSLDPAALLRGDRRRVLAVLRKGLASPEHAAFVARLAARE